MINKFGDYDSTQAYTEGEILPKDGYVCKILNARIDDDGQSVVVAYDIAEGKYTDYFKKRFNAKKNEDKKWSANYKLYIPKDDGSEKDGWTKRTFKTFTNALEDSNEGYHFDWDEQKFKGKLIGGLFRYEEFMGQDNKPHKVAKMNKACTVDKIHSGNFKLPDDKLLPTNTNKSDFMNIPDEIDEEIPFN